MGSPAPNLDLPLECLLETKPEHQLGKPITVTGTLRNAGPSAVWVLTWNTFLEEGWLDCLSVTHDGESVPYVGKAVSRGKPSKESYVRIPAGESQSREIDISTNYDITEPGDYQFFFRMRVLGALEAGAGEWPQEEDQYK